MCSLHHTDVSGLYASKAVGLIDAAVRLRVLLRDQCLTAI